MVAASTARGAGSRHPEIAATMIATVVTTGGAVAGTTVKVAETVWRLDRVL